MQINAINGVSFSGLQKTQLKNNAPSSNVAFEGEEDNKISNRSLTNATKALALSTLLTLGTAGLTSCDIVLMKNIFILLKFLLIL